MIGFRFAMKTFPFLSNNGTFPISINTQITAPTQHWGAGVSEVFQVAYEIEMK